MLLSVARLVHIDSRDVRRQRASSELHVPWNPSNENAIRRKKQTCHTLIKRIQGHNGQLWIAFILLPCDVHTSMAYSQSSGIFDRWIYAEIIKAGLEDWTPEDYIRRCGSTPYRASVHDVEALSFLSSCCLVSKEWLSLARPLLYASWRIGQLQGSMLVLCASV